MRYTFGILLAAHCAVNGCQKLIMEFNSRHHGAQFMWHMLFIGKPYYSCNINNGSICPKYMDICFLQQNTFYCTTEHGQKRHSTQMSLTKVASYLNWIVVSIYRVLFPRLAHKESTSRRRNSSLKCGSFFVIICAT
jgi:hypothetical protein